MARPFWSGQLRISLVSFGIKLFPAIEAKSEIRFHQIDRRSGQRVRHQKVSSEDEEPVEKGEIVKGYEYSKGQFIQIEPSEIEQLRITSQHSIALEQFVRTDEIDSAFYEKPYFVLPENDSESEAFAVVRAAFEQTQSRGLGKIAFGGRERLIAIGAPNDSHLKGMMAYTLRFAEEVRDAAEYFAEVKAHKVDHEQLTLAKELIERKTSPFEPDKFKDQYEAALRELVDAKLKHIELPKEQKHETRGKVINLMDALRQSVAERDQKKKPVVRSNGEPAKSNVRAIDSKAHGKQKRKKSA